MLAAAWLRSSPRTTGSAGSAASRAPRYSASVLIRTSTDAGSSPATSVTSELTGAEWSVPYIASTGSAPNDGRSRRPSSAMREAKQPGSENT